MTAYWLVKSEPDSFSWDQQVAHGIEPWTGVRNHTARRNLQAMQVGDQAFFYHSNTSRAIVGIVAVARAAYPDPTADSGGWVCVDMRAVQPLARPVTLAEIKAAPHLAQMVLVRQARLSVQPVTGSEWKAVLRLASGEEAA